MSHPEKRGSVRVTIPIRTQTEGNTGESWRVRAGRAKRQRQAVAAVLPMHLLAAGWLRKLGYMPTLPLGGVVVTLTRLAPGPGLDPHDNLPGSAKHCVDQITVELGLRDDRSPMVEWRYDQRRTKRKDLTPWGLEILIEPRER